MVPRMAYQQVAPASARRQGHSLAMPLENYPKSTSVALATTKATPEVTPVLVLMVLPRLAEFALDLWRGLPVVTLLVSPRSTSHVSVSPHSLPAVPELSTALEVQGTAIVLESWLLANHCEGRKMAVARHSSAISQS